MKKSIFLFFAAILCSMSASAWGYKTAAGDWSDCSKTASKFTNVTMNSGQSQDIVILKDVGDGVNILQNECDGHALYCKWTKATGDIFRGTARWANEGLCCDETVVIPEGKVYIKVGSGDQVQMTAGTDYTYTADVTFSTTGQSYTVYGETVEAATIDNQNSMPDSGKPASLTMNNSYTSKNSGNVHIVFDLKTNKVTEAGETPVEPTEDIYTIKGDGGLGLNWTVNDHADDMTKQAEGHYTLEKTDLTLSASTTYNYKVIKNGTWDWSIPQGSGNQTIKVDKDGKYDVVFTLYLNKESDQLTYTTTLKEEVKIIPTVAMHGNFQSTWADTDNFTVSADEKTATLTLTNLAAGNYNFGMRINGKDNWTSNGAQLTRTAPSAEIKAGNGDCSLYADATGDYTFTWTYETNTLTVTFPAETGEEIQHTYTVVGPKAMFSTDWDTNSAENVMTKQADGSYTKTLTDVTLAANATYEYKIVRDQSWDWKGLGESNLTFKVDKSGIYDITFVLNAEATTAEVKTTLKKEETIILDAYVAGNEALTGSNFTLEEKNKMTYDSETETYSHTLTGLKANTYYELKVVHGSAWLGYDKLSTVPAGVTEGENQNICFKLASDGNLTVTYNATAGITLEGSFYVFDGSNQPSTLYFRPNTAWKSDGARFAAYFFGTAEKWANMTDADGDGIYEVANDKKNANVIFCRMNPDVAENNWDSKWNQTGDIEIPNAAINLNTCYAFWTNNIDNTAGTWVVPETIGSGDNSAFYTKYAGKTINVIVERTFTKGVLHTICLPFSLPANWIGTAHQLSSVKSNDANELVVYTKKCATLEAGKPYILEPTNDELAAKEYLLVDNVTISTTLTNNTAKNKDFIVTLKGILSSDNSQTNGTTEYYIGIDGNLHQDATNKLALRSIVEITNASGQPVQGVRARVAFNENVETGVEDLFSTDAPVKVIENGQLIIIRDGVKYNVQGQMVK